MMPKIKRTDYKKKVTAFGSHAWGAVKSHLLQTIAVIAGLGLIAGGGIYTQISPALGAILLTLGGTILSAVIIGVLLNAIWWQKWTKKALVSLFQDPDMIGSIGLDRKKLRERLLNVICAVYGSQAPSSKLKRLLHRDILERLEFPIRRNYHVSQRVEMLPSDDYDLVSLTRTVRYTVYCATDEARQKPLFSNGVVLQGFIDVPDALLATWRSRLASIGVEEKDSEEARAELKNLVVEEVPLIKLGDFFIDGAKCSTSEIILDQLVNGEKPDPSIAYKVEYKGEPTEIPPVGGEIEICYSYSLTHNVFSYSFIALAGLTEGMTAHLSYDQKTLKGTLRYLLPFYWSQGEKLMTQSQEGEVDFMANGMLLAGHGLLCSWYPRNVKLSKTKSEEWVARDSVTA